MDFMSILWLAAIILFGLMEAATAGLVSVWFVAGAVAALVAALLHAAAWVQVALFLVVSAVALALTRPLVRKMNRGAEATNLDRVIGRHARVTETIDNALSRGEVYAEGKAWSARSEDGGVISEGADVIVTRMEGVKLFVKPSEEKTEVE